MGGKVKIIVVKCRNENDTKSNCDNINWTRTKFAGLKKNLSAYDKETMGE